MYLSAAAFKTWKTENWIQVIIENTNPGIYIPVDTASVCFSLAYFPPYKLKKKLF